MARIAGMAADRRPGVHARIDSVALRSTAGALLIARSVAANTRLGSRQATGQYSRDRSLDPQSPASRPPSQAPSQNNSGARGRAFHVRSKVSYSARRAQRIRHLTMRHSVRCRFSRSLSEQTMSQTQQELSEGNKIKRTSVRRLLRSQVFVCTLGSAPRSGSSEGAARCRFELLFVAQQHNAPRLLKTCFEAAVHEYLPHEQRHRIRFRLPTKGR